MFILMSIVLQFQMVSNALEISHLKMNTLLALNTLIGLAATPLLDNHNSITLNTKSFIRLFLNVIIGHVKIAIIVVESSVSTISKRGGHILN